MSEANPDRERRSKDHAATTQDPSAAPAGLTDGTDPESTVVRPRPRTKPRTGAARTPRPAGTRKVTPTQAPATMYERAQMLAGKRTALLGARALDILHVAVALELQAASFFTFDRRQARLARSEGLATPVRIR